MYSFIIQKTKEHVDSDSAILIESIEYQKFIGNTDYGYFTTPSVDYIDSLKLIQGEKIPIGSVEFVKEFIDKYKLPNKKFKPIFLDNEFTKHQKVTDSLLDIENALNYNEEVFIKPFDTFKSDFSDSYGYIFNKKDIHLFESDKKYLLSKVENIISEYRIFIFFGDIKGIYNYSGDFTEFLNNSQLTIIKKMINSINIERLNAYTLDIAILENKNIKLLEVHPFSSCGLYGFNDYSIIPQMYINGFKYLTSK